MPCSWIRSSVQGTNLPVLFLMWMYDQFLNQIGGRSFRPMIPNSPTVVPHLFAILEDTRHFSLFSSDELMFILMHHGLMIHLLRGICGLTRDTHDSMRIIMNRVLRYSIAHRSCYSRIQVLVKSFYSRDYHPLNIWFFLSLIVVLPKPQAILDISRSDLSDCQMEHYEIVALMTLFRDLVDRKNRVFSLFCNFVMEEENSESAILCRQFEKDFRQARRSRDYTVFMRYFEFISTFFLFSGIRHPMHSEIRWCLNIMHIFLTKMNNSSNNNWQFFAAVFETKSVDGVLSLLGKGCEPISYRRLDKEPFTLKFTLQYPPNGTSPLATLLKRNISQALEKAYSFRIPQHLLQTLDQASVSYLFNFTYSKWSRMLLLLCTFIELVQSNHQPHLCFVLDSYIFMKTSQSRCLDQLAILLNVGHAQDFKLQSFDRLFYRFCRFSNPNAGFSDITERTFIELFDLMMRILSENNFLDLLSEFLSNGQSLDDFIHHLAPRYPQFVTQIFQCRNTYCSECGEFLLPDCTEMCERCAICIHYAQLQNGDHGYSSD